MNLKDFYSNISLWGLQYGTRLITGIFVLLIGLWIIRLLKKLVQARMSKREIHSSLQPFFLSLTITGLNILLFYMVLDIVGIPMTIFATVLGTAGVAVGLALSGTFQNFAGGVLILLLKPFALDDNIVAQGVDGVVTSIQIFYTVVLTGDNKTVIIPNGKLFNEVIINVTREGKRRVDFEIKLGYAVNVDEVTAIIRDAIKKVDTILPKYEPIIGVSAMEIDGVKFIVKVWSNTNVYSATNYKLQEHILRDLKAAGVKLPGVV
ncbi:mechanosensitive ion channel [Mucilaginibacter sp. HMF5004]|uniref:mechanosensitive ion channel family protein n=1 Tax=Mucilaginibacter rivuli TaxID=2857527 RepID=UPI001C5EAC99|nr:mechanosensitive ion channel domain-containing protein [Mucilaginibacter rivuli]MBW4891084.1 mechanosensitive ion channel [Mucilaginibacter rivuli]